MSKKEVKTNAMRILDRRKIPYEYEEYDCEDFIDGIQVADQLGYSQLPLSSLLSAASPRIFPRRPLPLS